MRNSSSLHSKSSRRDAVLAERAGAMRATPTPSEARIFEAVRGGRLGVAFRRQVPLVGRFIGDLVAAEVMLVVEIDGEYHEGRAEPDARRDRALVRAGYTVLRLEAAVVMGDVEAAMAIVAAEVARLRGV